MDPIAANQRGVTLIELLVGIIIAGIVVGGAFTVLTTTERATRGNDQAVQTQQNVRMAMDLLVNDLKVAGFGATIPVGNCQVTVAGTSQAAPIVPGDHNPAGPDTGPDKISLVVPVSNTNPSWVLQIATPQGFNQLTLKPGAAAAMVAAGLSVGTNGRNLISIAGLTTAQVQSVAGDTLTLTTPIPTPAYFAANTSVYLLNCVTYQIIQAPDPNRLCNGNVPCLVRGVTTAASPLECNVPASPCVPIVDGIEDLQFVYACDGCNALVNGGIRNGIVDDQGAILDNAMTDVDWLANTTWTIAPLVPGTIRLVRIGILAKQPNPDQGFSEGITPAQNSSGPYDVSLNADHVVTLAATEAQYRRRTLVRTVDLRNAGLQ